MSRGRGDDAVPALVRVDGKGELALVELDDLRYSKAMIANDLNTNRKVILRKSDRHRHDRIPERIENAGVDNAQSVRASCHVGGLAVGVESRTLDENLVRVPEQGKGSDDSGRE